MSIHCWHFPSDPVAGERMAADKYMHISLQSLFLSYFLLCSQFASQIWRIEFITLPCSWHIISKGSWVPLFILSFCVISFIHSFNSFPCSYSFPPLSPIILMYTFKIYSWKMFSLLSTCALQLYKWGMCLVHSFSLCSLRIVLGATNVTLGRGFSLWHTSWCTTLCICFCRDVLHPLMPPTPPHH